jgi:thiosulfate/3-mercaptopyruvate sulfurtransferase
MTYRTLIDAPALEALVREPAGLVVVDCRFDLAKPDAGERAYREHHIPGAVYAHLDRDLSGHKSGSNGRHPLPPPDALAAALGRLGIDSSVQVVAYDQDSGMFASRLWWLLRWMGHDAVAVLDGGLAAWLRERFATRSGEEANAPRTFVGTSNASMVTDAVGAAQAAIDGRLIDARAPERYRGDVEPIDRVGGHIPGAANRFFQHNLADGRFLPGPDLRQAFDQLLAGVSADRAVCYCGSGVTACHNLLAMQHAGLDGGRLYPGSWSEWVANPDRPIERG